MKHHVLSFALATLLIASGARFAVAGHHGSNQTSSSATDPDNTGINVRDKSAHAVTADQQSNDSDDIDLASNVRNAIESNRSLSTDARNVKVVVANGTVTLRGPVSSKAEKSEVVRAAKSVPGVHQINDRLEIAGNRATR